MFSHKAFPLNIHVDSCLEQPVFREEVGELENELSFLKENFVRSLLFLFCALQEIRSD